MEQVGELSVGRGCMRELKTGIRSIDRAKKGLAVLPLPELIELYWITLNDAVRLADCQAQDGSSPQRNQAVADEVAVLYAASTEVVRIIDDRFTTVSEVPYSTVLAERAYEQLGERMLHGQIGFDFSGYDSEIIADRHPTQA